MRKRQFTRVIAAVTAGFFILPSVLFGTTLVTEAKKQVPIDTSIESSRECGTDLYEATKAYQVLPLTLSFDSGSSTSKLLDADYATSITCKAGEELTVTCDELMDSVYIVWDSLVPEWKLRIEEQEYTYGTEGFLHEYIKLPKQTNSLTIVVGDGSVFEGRDGSVKDGARISDVYAFSEGELPSFVQTWDPVCEEADILLVPTHSDDEDIFFGGIMPIYGAEQGFRVQVVYLVQHWVYSSNSKIREHEKLNGLWAAGCRNYPIVGDFRDAYSENLTDAERSISLADATSFLTECIRRTKPLVVVAHDTAGEYGHGQHMLASAACVEAVENAGRADFDAPSYEKYGTFNVPKTYLHLYKENPVKIPMRDALTAFDGKTAIEVARQAYLCHESQQYAWFTVDDYGEYSNADFGLYRTYLKADETGNDLMESLRDVPTELVRMEAALATTEDAGYATVVFGTEDATKEENNLVTVTEPDYENAGLGYTISDGVKTYLSIPALVKPEPSVEPVDDVEAELDKLAAEEAEAPEEEEKEPVDYTSCVLISVATLVITVAMCVWYFRVTARYHSVKHKKKNKK